MCRNANGSGVWDQGFYSECLLMDAWSQSPSGNSKEVIKVCVGRLVAPAED